MREIRMFVCAVATVIGALAVSARPGLLWRVTPPDADAPESWVLGTCHVAPPCMLDSIHGLRDCLVRAERVVGELAPDQYSDSVMEEAMFSHGIAPADSTLSTVLSPAELSRIDSLLARYTGHRGMTKMMNMLKPAVIESQIASLQAFDCMGLPADSPPLDILILREAERLGRGVEGLETADEQMALLMADPISLQAASLVEAVDRNDELADKCRLLLDAYVRQDLDALMQLCLEPEPGSTEAELERLIYARNRAWVSQLDPLLGVRSMLVVVGAGHLGGEHGLLELLRQRGYAVTPMQ